MLAKDKNIMPLRSHETLFVLTSFSEWCDDFSMLTTDVLISKLISIWKELATSITWDDESSLSSHSHLLMTVVCLYDRVVFLPGEEHYKKEGVHVNVQGVVDKPFIHILARTPAKDQQLVYSENQLEDTFVVKTPIEVDGIYLYDILRAFICDYPPSQFKAGHQKGGNFVCHCCAIDWNCHRSQSQSLKFLTL